jgi:hypothetical protein
MFKPNSSSGESDSLIVALVSLDSILATDNLAWHRALQERAGGSVTISLFEATASLSRREAAKIFLHILGKTTPRAHGISDVSSLTQCSSAFTVGRADSMIKVCQEKPYSDILVTFPEAQTGSY